MRAFLLTILFSCALALGLAPAALALSPLDPLATDLMDLHATDIADGNFNLNADGNSVNVIVGQVIKVFLGLFATIFIVLTLMAGFKYMTSRGDSKKVAEAVAASYLVSSARLPLTAVRSSARQRRHLPTLRSTLSSTFCARSMQTSQ
jgi:hypothetical protein